MHITIDIETDHPDAYDHLCADLAGLVTGLVDDGRAGATWVEISERADASDSTALRKWIGERDHLTSNTVPCVECATPIVRDPYSNEWLHVVSDDPGCIGFDTVAAPR